MTGTAGQSTRAGDSRRSPGAGGRGPTSEAGPLLRAAVAAVRSHASPRAALTHADPEMPWVVVLFST